MKRKKSATKILKTTPTFKDWDKLVKEACKAEKASEVAKLVKMTDTWDSLPVDLLNAEDDPKLVEKWEEIIFEKWGKLLEKRLSQLDLGLKRDSDLGHELCGLRDIIHTT